MQQTLEARARLSERKQTVLISKETRQLPTSGKIKTAID